MRSKLLLLLFSFPLLAIGQINDYGTWLSAGLSKDVTKNISFSAEGQARIDVQYGELATSFVDASLKFKITKFAAVAFDYRFGNRKQDDGYYNLRQRSAFNLYLDHKFGKVKVAYRGRYQLSQSAISSGEEIADFSNAFRSKLSVKRKIAKRTAMGMSGELYITSDNDGNYSPSDMRLSAKVERKVGKRTYLSGGIIMDRAFDRMVPKQEFILSLGYTYEFKGKFFKKKNKIADAIMPD
ncbi:MAG: hypothetical protein ACI84C_000621 [Flavobacteriales bacterium]|jgi:hypothetical protein